MPPPRFAHIKIADFAYLLRPTVLFKELGVLLLLCILLVFNRAAAQTNQPFCATTGGANAVGPLGNGLSSPPPGPIFLRIYVYKLGNEAGQHMPTDEQIQTSILNLKKDFEAHDIFFVWNCAIEEIQSDILDGLYLAPPGFPPGPKPDCALSAYVTHTDGISVFIGGDDSYAMGVTTDIPGKAILVKGQGGSGNNAYYYSRSHVISHEMGNCLGLWHTHHGYENDLDCNGSQGDPNECPDDDAAGGSTSWICGDYVQDTPADPGLSENDIIQHNCQYTGTLTDPFGAPYTPDPTLIMSYTHPSCMISHSAGQGIRMRAIIASDDFLQNCMVAPQVSSITIDVFTPSGTTNFPSTVWDLSNLIGGEILIDNLLTIENGATLTINPGVVVRFGEHGRLVIKQNARLVLRGTLTSMGCTQYWDGVVVYGNSSASQSPTNGVYAQGRLDAYSGLTYQSVIENARTGVTLYGPNLNSSGGQMHCQGTLFRNNIIGVEISKYQNFDPLTHQRRPYRASFTKCAFTNDDLFPHDELFHSFLHMTSVGGIDIFGCSFSNNRTISGSQITDWGYGIWAADAGFNVTGAALPCPPTPCDDVTPSAFKNLGYGIYVLKSVFNRPFLVKECNFGGCFVGLRNVSVTGATIIQNNFDLGGVPSNTIIPISGNPLADNGFQHQVGIILEKNIHGWSCQENTFTKTGTNSAITTIGIMALATGDGNKVIRKNNFTGLSIGNLANGVNITVNGSIPDLTEGLLYQCNNNYDVVDKDFSVPSGMIRRLQGTNNTNGQSQSAGNRFSYTGIDFSAFWANDPTNPNPFITYRYLPNISNEEPIALEGIVHKFAAFEGTGCANQICSPPCREESELAGIKSDYYSHKIDYQILLSDYASAPTEQKEAGMEYHRRMMSEGAYEVLLYGLYDTLTYEADTLHDWIKNLETLDSRIWLATEEFTVGNGSAAHQHLTAAATEYSLSSNQQTDLDHYAALIDILSEKDIYELDQSTLDNVLTYANEENRYTAPWARNIISTNGGSYFPPDYILESSQEKNQTNSTSVSSAISTLTDRSLSVTPNPTNSDVYFRFTPSEQVFSATLQIFDQVGTLQAKFLLATTGCDIKWATGNTVDLFC